MSSTKYFWGVDCGSAVIKVVTLDPTGNPLYKSKQQTLFPLPDHVRRAMLSSKVTPAPLTGNRSKTEHFITVTGYGRHHLDFADDRLTEIRAHFLGVQHNLAISTPFTIIDIGGQDSKIITVRDAAVERFVVNRKCAAGTGAFIEELAHRLQLDLEDLTRLAKQHDKSLVLNSYCTVFACQEAMRILMNGEKIPNLIHALYESVAKRVLEMTALETKKIVFSGGVAHHHPILIELFQKYLKDGEITLAPDAQYCGAMGAALHGIRSVTGKKVGR